MEIYSRWVTPPAINYFLLNHSEYLGKRSEAFNTIGSKNKAFSKYSKEREQNFRGRVQNETMNSDFEAYLC